MGSIFYKLGDLATPACVSDLRFYCQQNGNKQWNPSNMDTIGTEGSVLIKKVSSLQGLNCKTFLTL